MQATVDEDLWWHRLLDPGEVLGAERYLEHPVAVDRKLLELHLDPNVMRDDTHAINGSDGPVHQLAVGHPRVGIGRIAADAIADDVKHGHGDAVGDIPPPVELERAVWLVWPVADIDSAEHTQVA